MSMTEWESERLLEISNATGRTVELLEQADDLATRVAADLFVDWTGRYLGQYAKDEEVGELAGNAKRFGRIFAEAVAKEGK